MESLSVLKDKLIEIVMVETENIFSKGSLFNVDFKNDDSVQITIINDRRTFDLLSNTWKRHKSKKENEENNKRNVHNQLNLS